MTMREKAWRVVLYGAAALALGAGLVQAVCEPRTTPLPVGSSAPAFVALRPDGAPFSFSDADGQVVVISFWASWCGACQHELAMLQRVSTDSRTHGVTFIAASIDDADGRAEALSAWRKRGGDPSFLVFPDETTIRAWRVETLPTLYVLGRDGRIVAGHVGVAPEAKLRLDIDKGLSGPTVTTR